MQRRAFLKTLFSVFSALPFLVRPALTHAGDKAASKEVLLQTSPVAGFQFYNGEKLWNRLKPGAILQLVAEPDNPHDSQAVKVMFDADQLGYVPRRENTAISQMLVRGQALVARISELRQSTAPWARITMNIYLVQG